MYIKHCKYMYRYLSITHVCTTDTAHSTNTSHLPCDEDLGLLWTALDTSLLESLCLPSSELVDSVSCSRRGGGGRPWGITWCDDDLVMVLLAEIGGWSCGVLRDVITSTLCSEALSRASRAFTSASFCCAVTP